MLEIWSARLQFPWLSLHGHKTAATVLSTTPASDNASKKKGFSSHDFSFIKEENLLHNPQLIPPYNCLSLVSSQSHTYPAASKGK